jgi:SRSO17 transposase
MVPNQITVPNCHPYQNVDYYVSNLPFKTERAVFAELIHQLRTVKTEQRCLHRLLSARHFEGRSWLGFHHHVVLSMLAWEFLKRHPEHAA